MTIRLMPIPEADERCLGFQPGHSNPVIKRRTGSLSTEQVVIVASPIQFKRFELSLNAVLRFQIKSIDSLTNLIHWRFHSHSPSAIQHKADLLNRTKIPRIWNFNKNSFSNSSIFAITVHSRNELKMNFLQSNSTAAQVIPIPWSHIIRSGRIALYRITSVTLSETNIINEFTWNKSEGTACNGSTGTTTTRNERANETFCCYCVSLDFGFRCFRHFVKYTQHVAILSVSQNPPTGYD